VQTTKSRAHKTAMLLSVITEKQMLLEYVH